MFGALGLPRMGDSDKGTFSIGAVYRALDRKAARHISKPGQFSGVYCYEDGAYETFKRASEMGVRRFYDLPIGYWKVWRGIMDEEKQREPEWAHTLQGISDSDEKVARKDEEMQLAESIFVASSFTKNTLERVPKQNAKVRVIPYGSPPLGPSRKKRSCVQPLKVLFVGALSQRKGLSYLFSAMSLLRKHVVLTLIGVKPSGVSKALETALRGHRWLSSMPHNAVLAEMRKHDVLVFPSLFEGFGLVILEAMSQGLPVITTAHTAGPDIITDGRDGFIVPVRSHQCIAEKISLLADNVGLLADMQEEARNKAGTLSWRRYREALCASIRETLDLSE